MINEFYLNVNLKCFYAYTVFDSQFVNRYDAFWICKFDSNDAEFHQCVAHTRDL